MSVLKRVGSALNRLPSTDIIAPAGGGPVIVPLLGINFPLYTPVSSANVSNSANLHTPNRTDGTPPTSAGPTPDATITHVGCYIASTSAAPTRVELAVFNVTPPGGVRLTPTTIVAATRTDVGPLIGATETDLIVRQELASPVDISAGWYCVGIRVDTANIALYRDATGGQESWPSTNGLSDGVLVSPPAWGGFFIANGPFIWAEGYLR